MTDCLFPPCKLKCAVECIYYGMEKDPLDGYVPRVMLGVDQEDLKEEDE